MFEKNFITVIEFALLNFTNVINVLNMYIHTYNYFIVLIKDY